MSTHNLSEIKEHSRNAYCDTCKEKVVIHKIRKKWYCSNGTDIPSNTRLIYGALEFQRHKNNNSW